MPKTATKTSASPSALFSKIKEIASTECDVSSLRFVQVYTYPDGYDEEVVTTEPEECNTWTQFRVDGIGKFQIRCRKGIDEEILASVTIEYMPGCCGVVVITGVWVEERLQGCGIGKLMHELAENIAKRNGYTAAIATDIMDNEAEIHILESRGWVHAREFVNSRTGHTVGIYTKQLAELPS